MKYLAIILFPLLAFSCSTMKFVNGPELEDTVLREKWHHLGFNGLVEFSKPLNITEACDNKQWDTITVEKTFFNSLADATTLQFSIYTPWTIFYECREPID